MVIRIVLGAVLGIGLGICGGAKADDAPSRLVAGGWLKPPPMPPAPPPPPVVTEPARLPPPVIRRPHVRRRVMQPRMQVRPPPSDGKVQF
jgi:hypothetical protein